MTKHIQIAVRVDADLYQALTVAAKLEGRSRENLIRWVMRRWLAAREKEAARIPD
jgi:hypothetical protein